MKLVKFIFMMSLLGLGGTTGYKLHEKGMQKGCVPLPAPVTTLDITQSNSEVLRFIAVGDTGANPEDQKQVAQAMKKVCDENGCDLLVGLGDNAYPSGMQSLQDPLFQTYFDNVYGDFKQPFAMILGNHDVKGNVYAQVNHSLQSPNWKMPNFEYNFQAGPVRFFAINTNCPLVPWMRLNDKLNQDSNNPKPWTVVLGHHPIYSGGTHGDISWGKRFIWNQLLKDKVDFYLSGHNHLLDHLRKKGARTDYVVSGSGGKHYRSPEEQKRLRASSAESLFAHYDTGFVWFEFSKKEVSVRYYDANGAVLYKFKKAASS